ncbi:MAG: hypothetical protein ACOCSA_02595 [Candidatus Hadarchaeota archaeon]
MGNTEIDWLVKKASDLLEDKVVDDSLDEQDVRLAFQMFVEPRLEKISDSFSEKDLQDVEKRIWSRLREKAWKLNQEYWEGGD